MSRGRTIQALLVLAGPLLALPGCSADGIAPEPAAAMAKGQQKGNREAKKPKADKNKPASGNTPSPSPKAKAEASSSAKK